MGQWIEACGTDDIDEEDLIRFDHAGKTYAIYRSPDSEYFATDGLCTHEKVHLADGLVGGGSGRGRRLRRHAAGAAGGHLARATTVRVPQSTRGWQRERLAKFRQ